MTRSGMKRIVHRPTRPPCPQCGKKQLRTDRDPYNDRTFTWCPRCKWVAEPVR